MKVIKWLLIVIVGIFAAGVGILMAMGARSDAGVMRASVEIAKPPAKVWPWITEPDKLKSWVSWTVETRRIDDKHLVLVMADANNNNERVEIHDEIVAMDAPRSLTVKQWATGAFTGESRFTLVDLGGKTRVETISTFRYDHWMARLFEPLITPEASKKEVADFAKLKELVEHEP